MKNDQVKGIQMTSKYLWPIVWGVLSMALAAFTVIRFLHGQIWMGLSDLSMTVLGVWVALTLFGVKKLDSLWFAIGALAGIFQIVDGAQAHNTAYMIMGGLLTAWCVVFSFLSYRSEKNQVSQ
jgi:hypothetical protein